MSARWRRPLVEPGFGQRLPAERRNRRMSIGCCARIGRAHVEHRALALDRIERPRGRDLDRAARERDDRLDLRVARRATRGRRRRSRRRSARRNSARLPPTTPPMPLRVATSGRRERWRRRHLRAPVQAIRVRAAPAGRQLAPAGIPERDDVVEGLVRDRNLDQIDRAFAQAATAARPTGSAGGRRTRRRPGSDRSCDRAAAARSRAGCRRRTAEAHGRRIDERAPDPLAAAGPHREAVGVVDLRTPVVVDAAIVLAVWNMLVSGAMPRRSIALRG